MHRAYDIRHRLLQADTARLRHRNAPHRRGDRYAIVLFNKDLSYKGTRECARSCAIREAPPLGAPRYLATREGEAKPERDTRRAVDRRRLRNLGNL